VQNEKKIKLFLLSAFTFIILGILLGLFINRIDLIIRGLFISIPILLSLIIIYKYNLSFTYVVKLPKLILLDKLFYLCFLISIVILYLYPYRNTLYFLFMSIMFFILSIEIIFGNKNYMILLRIILLFLNLSFGVTLKYPFFYSNTDSIGHYYFTQITLLTGRILPVGLDEGYHYFPLFHIYLAMENLFTNINEIYSYFIFSTIPFSFTILFIYLLFEKIIKNKKIALLSCLIYSVSPIIVLFSHYEVTRVFAFNGFIILIYLLYKFSDKIISYSSYFITTIISIYTILVHHASIVLIMIELTIIWLLNKIYKIKNFPKYMVLSLIIIIIFYNVFISYSFTIYLITSHFNIPLFEKIVFRDKLTDIMTWIRNNIPITIFLFYFAFSLNYLIITNKKYLKINILIIFSIINLIFYIPTPLQTIWSVFNFFRLDRISLLISPIMSFSMALGFILIINNILKNKKNYLLGISLILLTSFAFFSMTSSDNAPDCIELNPSYSLDPSTGKGYFNVEEIKTLNYIVNYSYNNTSVYSNYPFARFFEFRKTFQDSYKYQIKTFFGYEIEENIPIIFHTNSLLIPFDTNFQYTKGFQRIYDNNRKQILITTK